MVGFPSGQRGQTVNLLAPPSKVRILLHPANLALTSLRCRGYFFVKKETATGHKAAPLCTPLGLFLGVLGCGGREFGWLVSVCDGAGNESLSRWRRTAWRGCWEWKSLEAVIGLWRYWLWKGELWVRVGWRWQVSMCGAHLRIFWNNIEVNLSGKDIKCKDIKCKDIKCKYNMQI